MQTIRELNFMISWDLQGLRSASTIFRQVRVFLFVHYHKTNEEIYIILSGKGKAVVDGEDIELSAGDIVRIAPDGKRQFFAADDSEISYACIQVKAGSLEAYTADDCSNRVSMSFKVVGISASRCP